MADPVTITETLATGYSPAEAQERLAAHFGSRVVENAAGTLVATSGSKIAIRLLGAYLMPKEWMPTKTTVEFAPSGRGCQATVACSDNFGFGIRTGMRRRYEGLLRAKLEEVRRVLPS
jgi:hypothetical protein